MPNRTFNKIVGFYKILHMKNIKKTIFAVLVLFVGTSLFFSCSNDNENDTKNPSSSSLDTFLKSFYNQDYALGNTISISNGTKSSAMSRTILLDGQDVEITEVILANNQRVRGYVLTDKVTSAFLYFVDVDRITYDLTVVDVTNNETLIFKDINTNPDYHSTDEFDLYKMAENYNQSTTNSSRNPWFGWGYSYGQPPVSGPCMVGVYKAYFIFGIQVTESVAVMEPNPNNPDRPRQVQVPCGTEYTP